MQRKNYLVATVKSKNRKMEDDIKSIFTKFYVVMKQIVLPVD